MIRAARPKDAAAIDAFLRPHTATSMFLRGNLADHGVGHSDHAHSTDYFLWETPGLSAVFGHTKAGYLMACAPEPSAEMFAAFACAIQGRQVVGMTGQSEAVADTLHACGCDERDYSLNRIEPLYQLDLCDLEAPAAQLRAVQDADIPLLSDWHSDYMRETGSLPGDISADEAGRRRAQMSPGSTMRLLIEKAEPRAMACVNAEVSGLVQVGGVYVPEPHRGQGLGGKVTAALLAEARNRGIQTAILFAASPVAARAYERIGFRLIGQYRVTLLNGPKLVQPRFGMVGNITADVQTVCGQTGTEKGPR